MRYLLTLFLFVFSLTADFKQVLPNDAATVYKDKAGKEELVTQNSEQTYNFRLVEEGETYSKVSYYDSSEGRGKIGYMENSSFTTEDKSTSSKSNKSIKLQLDKTLINEIKESFAIQNASELNTFLEELPDTYETHAIELDRTSNEIVSKEQQVKDLSESIKNTSENNGKLTKSLSDETRAKSKLTSETKTLTDETKGSTARIEDLNVDFALLKETTTKEINEANRKRQQWPIIAVVVALALGYFLNKGQ